ncbi:NAD-dependent succinate-semialdehyde dehydrogenase [Alishewanella longhuensis]|uniref:NAD-dependent succinate-semialdehyde dehydrogenase n=1 Tax=Alishewanella longhuensis TaxID=1091037 RepID=A0ABQ3KUU3_9ALTE|nr:NAD-dependent succinate-semialdehyde dehydrogenase [Alishewanella longhuensis]GHG61420.1 NAD-dependent succinate-semialdehyde dehydrogenase [Alishewanella longhuensis]
MLPLQDPTLLKTASYLNGAWYTQAKTQFAVYNPADGTLLATVAAAGAEHATEAVEAAAAAQPAWAALSAAERAKVLKRWQQLFSQHEHDLALLLTLEQGKPLHEAEAEIRYGASYLEWFAEEAKRLYGSIIPAPSSDKRILVQRQPVGVVSAITPWNFPNAMLMRKAAAALAAGCSFVVKAAQQTPLSALACAELAHRAGIPAGVFNVLVGTDAQGIGEVLTRHPKVNKFSFTGSTAVGKKLLQQCAEGVKRVTMELGGNAPFIVFADADLDAAVTGLLAAKFRNSGQTCVCANRVLVDDRVLAPFLAKLLPAVAALKVGVGTAAGTQLGPLIEEKALVKVEQLVADAIAKGAQLQLGGTRLTAHSLFYLPTILTAVTPQMALVQQEIFGPVLPIIRFSDEADAIALANATEYGLAAYFYSKDLGRVFRVAQALQFGMLGINEGIISNAAAPFGGIKQSGYGREGSQYGLDDYTDLKYLCIGGLAD